MTATAVVITGSVGTGKTTIAKKLQEEGYLTLNLFDFAKKYDCIEGRDEERNALIVNVDKLEDVLSQYLEAGYGIVVIEGHYSDIVPEKYVSKAFVLSASIVELQSRMRARNYSENKISENVEAELLQVCWTDALDAFGPTRVTKIENMSLEETVKIIKIYLDSKKKALQT